MEIAPAVPYLIDRVSKDFLNIFQNKFKQLVEKYLNKIYENKTNQIKKSSPPLSIYFDIDHNSSLHEFYSLLSIPLFQAPGFLKELLNWKGN